MITAGGASLITVRHIRQRKSGVGNRSSVLGDVSQLVTLAELGWPGAGEGTRFYAGCDFAALPSNPNIRAIPFMASMQKVMCSSRSTPRSRAPFTMSLRFTLRAKALSFNLFFTDLESSSARDLLGFTSVAAVINPANSSQANKVFSMGVSRVTPVYSAWDMMALRISSE